MKRQTQKTRETGRCTYLERCPDTLALRLDPGNKDLADQYDELCTAGGQGNCLTYRELSQQND
jgi:hypothetical protein